MRDPIDFYVWRESPGKEPTVYTPAFFDENKIDPDRAIAASGGRLEKHSVTLKDAYSWGTQCNVEKVAAQDETQRWAAMIEQYCAGWTLPQTCNAAGFNSLPPNLADKV